MGGGMNSRKLFGRGVPQCPRPPGAILCHLPAHSLAHALQVPFLVSLDRLLSRPYGPKGSFPKGSVGFDLRGIDFTSIPSTVTRRSPRGKLSHAGGMPGEHHSGVAGHPSIRGLSIRGLSHDPDVGAMLPPGSTWDDDSGGCMATSRSFWTISHAFPTQCDMIYWHGGGEDGESA